MNRVSTGLAAVILGTAAALVAPATAPSASVPSASRASLPPDCLPSASPEQSGSGLHLGFPRSPLRAPAVGTLRIAVLYVDFPDAPAQQSVGSLHAATIPEGLRHLEKLSHGRLRVTEIHTSQWVRMPKPMTDYLDAPGISSSGDLHHAFMADAVAAADPILDFRDIDIVGVVMDKAQLRPPLGIAMIGSPDFALIADGHEMYDGFTLMHPLFKVHTVVAHEILHNLGLVDLYDGSAPGGAAWPSPRNRFVGEFSIMGEVRGHSPELFAWEQWVLGWLEDDAISCVTTGTQEVTLSAVSATTGTRMATVPLGGNRFVAIEVRAKHGLDSPPRPGVLPYLVQPDIPTSSGPVRIPTRRDPEVIQPLGVGTQWVIEGVGVEVLSSQGLTYRVRVHAQAPAPTSPGSVAQLKASRAKSGVLVTWQAPRDTGWTTLTGYEYRVGTGPWTPATGTRVNIPSPGRGQSLVIEVRAVNAQGQGPSTRVNYRAR